MIEVVEALGLGSWGLLILLMGIVFFPGFFFDWIEITPIVLPVLPPIIEPIRFALFYMKAVAPKSIKIQRIYAGIIPFVMLQLVGLGLVVAFPDIALWLPRVLLN